MSCALLGTTMACATVERRAEWDRPWRELRTEHVTLYTDLSEKDALAAVRGFEARHHMLATALLGADPPSLRTRVIALRDEEAYRQVAPENAGAFYSPQLGFDAQPIPTIVMHGEPTASVHAIWQHELTHRFLRYAMGSMPTWLNEGLAEYYSTARAEGTTLMLGGYLDGIAFVGGGDWRTRRDGTSVRLHIPITQVTRPSQLLMLDRADFYVSHAKRADDDLHRIRKANYAASWAFVHMLISDPKYVERYGRLASLVADGMETRDAICVALGDVPLVELDDDFIAYIQRSTLNVWPQAYEPPADAEPEVAPLAAQHKLLLRSKIGARARRPGWERDATLHLGLALDLAPKDPWVLRTAGAFARATGNVERARTWLEDARAAEPGAKDTLLALISLYTDEQTPWSEQQRQEWLRELVAALEPTAETATELDALASYHVGRGQAERAISLSSRALQADPNCGSCFATHAVASFEGGQLHAAIRAQQLAIDRMHEHASQELLSAMQARLEQYRAAASNDPGAEPAATGDLTRCWDD
jgi:tetratricopeptide (TPR) repeat protein